MPLPLVIGIGAAATTALIGLFEGGNAIAKNIEANDVQKSAEEILDEARNDMEAYRKATRKYIANLGKTKLALSAHEITDFVETYSRLKQVNLLESEGLDEIKKLKFDDNDFAEMKDISIKAGSVVKGGLAGLSTGALVGCGVYGGVTSLACAGTGTAIGALHGIAATNATLAWIGGGTLAAGGLGVAGGTAILGGLISGPALMVLGCFASVSAGKKLDISYINLSEAKKYYKQVQIAGERLYLIAESAVIMNVNLKRLGVYLRRSIKKMKQIIERCDDWRFLSCEEKQVIAQAVNYAVTIKNIIDIPLLSGDGILTAQANDIREQHMKLKNSTYSCKNGEKLSKSDVLKWKKENLTSSNEVMAVIDPLINKEILTKISPVGALPEDYLIFAILKRTDSSVVCYSLVDRNAVDLDDIKNTL